MISKQLELEFESLFKQYVEDNFHHLSKSTQKQYYTEPLGLYKQDRGYDYWSTYNDMELFDRTLNITKDKWVLWTSIYSESPSATNHHNAISGYKRILEFLNNNTTFKNRIVESNLLLLKEVAQLIIMHYESDSLLDELHELTGHDTPLLEVWIQDYAYLKGYHTTPNNMSIGLLYYFLDSFEGDTLDSALLKVKEYLRYRYESQLYLYPNRYEELDAYAKQRGSHISFNIDESNDYKIQYEYDIHNIYYLLYSGINENEILVSNSSLSWNTNDSKLNNRVLHLPVGAKVVYTQEIDVTDHYAKDFDKAQQFLYMGEITHNPQNGESIDILWDKQKLDKVWYRDTFQGDTTLIRNTHWRNQNLLEYLNDEGEQNMDRYISEFSKNKSRVDRFEESLVNDDEVIPDENTYTKSNFLEEVYIDSQQYEVLQNLITTKKNVIIQGAPGVGKTFMAKRLAYSYINKIDSKFVTQIQFHQSYGYEDLIMGYKPTESHFELKYGPFYKQCMAAIENPDEDYFFIIDEINRGNISKIFGELLMLIESDKRGEEHAITLMYSNESFYVPKNIHIIGLMNTADRSLAVLDYALRRRFSFYNLKPAFNNSKFKAMLTQRNNSKLDHLVRLIEKFNIEILNDDSLGSGFEIGHSYFTSNLEAKDLHVSNIIEYEIIPLITEYWYDDQTKVNDYTEQLRSVLNE